MLHLIGKDTLYTPCNIKCFHDGVTCYNYTHTIHGCSISCILTRRGDWHDCKRTSYDIGKVYMMPMMVHVGCEFEDDDHCSIFLRGVPFKCVHRRIRIRHHHNIQNPDILAHITTSTVMINVTRSAWAKYYPQYNLLSMYLFSWKIFNKKGELLIYTLLNQIKIILCLRS